MAVGHAVRRSTPPAGTRTIAAPGMGAPMTDSKPEGPDGGRLLVVDDDPLVGGTMARIARAADFEVRVVSDASAFVQALESWKPTHITLDLRMPGMDGMEAIAELGRRRYPARIIIASGVGERVLAAAARSAVEHGLAIGHVLAKPFTVSEFREALSPARSAPAEEPSDGHGRPAPASPVDLERALAAAISADGLAIDLQPEVNLRDGSVRGFEALVRWHHDAWGSVPPSTFLPVAERLGLMVPLTEGVIRRVAEWLRGRDGPAGRALSVAINVSAAVVTDGVVADERTMAFEDWAEARCHSLGMDPEQVIFELTETDAMSDSLSALDTLTRLRMKGFQLSIDDFGTGYSSLARLARLPFSQLKIDRSFVAEMATSRDAAAIVRVAVDLAHSLRLVCVAEGIEDAPTMGLLRELGCELGQGYHLARPMAPDDATAWLAGRGAPFMEGA